MRQRTRLYFNRLHQHMIDCKDAKELEHLIAACKTKLYFIRKQVKTKDTVCEKCPMRFRCNTE